MTSPLTDEELVRLWQLMRDAPPRTWRDRVRYVLAWRPGWALRQWRRRRSTR